MKSLSKLALCLLLAMSLTVSAFAAQVPDSLVNVPLMLCLMRQPLYGRSAEYADNRISLFSAQWGKCAVTGRNFVISEDIHCHHKKPRQQGGTDKFENLVLVFESVHRLIHATDNKTIEKYLEKLELNKKQLQKVNEFRTQLELQEIA